MSHSTKDTVGFVFQLASKAQFPSFRRYNWNYKFIMINKRARELASEEIKNNGLYTKISNGGGGTCCLVYFFNMISPLKSRLI